MSLQLSAGSSLQPVAPAERIFSLDVLRGAAIFGVLIAYTVWNLGGPPIETYSTADRILNFTLATLIDTKAYTLLAFLFGLGFSMQLLRAAERGVSVVPAYVRRLLALMAIGVVHSLLLRNGDILVPYATMGFVLLLFRNASNRVLLVGIIAGALFPYLAHWVWLSSGIPFPKRPDTTGMGHIASNIVWAGYWYATAITNWPGSLPMFLAGLYVGRRQVFEDVAAHGRGLRRVLIIGLIIGVGVFFGRFVIIEATPKGNNPSFLFNMSLGLLWSLHAWGSAAFYASATLLLLQRRWVRVLLSPVAAVGRMALTNYLLQSIMIVPACIIFDIYDRVTPSLGLLMAIIVALVQVPFSIWWLRRFRFGPAEWLWRSLTYQKVQLIRLAAALPERRSAGVAA